MFKEKRCKVCGETFTPTSSRQVCCNKPVTVYCEVCGKAMEYKCTTVAGKSTCSPKCTAALIKQKREASASKLVKTCKWCGAEFTPKSTRDVYCDGPHYKTCEVCGEEFEIDVRKDSSVKSCSPECKKVLQLKNRDFETERKHQEETFMRKYGVKNAMQIPGVVENLRESNLSKYGVDWYTQTDEYKAKVLATSQERYGCDHHLQNAEVQQKRRDTCLSKYGVENASQDPDVKNRIKSTMLSKYGVANYGQVSVADLEAWNNFKSDPSSYILNKFGTKVTITELCKEFGVTICSIYNHLDEKSAALIKRSVSYMEEELIEFLESLDPNLEIQTHVRSIINPYELDIYLPQYKIAIECNPTYTHNSSVPTLWDDRYLSINYHKMKTDLCASHGIFLFHIFGYEWSHKKEIIKSMIKNLIGKTDTVIYARKCEIKSVGYDEATEFLQVNHRQGFAVSKIRLGLYYNGTLVALMTFSKPRPTIGSNQYDYELVRFCSLLNTTIVGGASKLFKHFIKTYNPSSVISFSDRAHTKGTLYLTLGFTEDHISNPGYMWVSLKSDIAYHRTSAQKHRLSKLLGDENIDLTKSESQIMIEHEYVKVYDSGSTIWVYSA